MPAEVERVREELQVEIVGVGEEKQDDNSEVVDGISHGSNGNANGSESTAVTKPVSVERDNSENGDVHIIMQADVLLSTYEGGEVDTESSKVNGSEDIPKDVCEDTCEEVGFDTKRSFDTEFPLLSNGKGKRVAEGELEERYNGPSWATTLFVRYPEPEVIISTDTTHTGNEASTCGRDCDEPTVKPQVREETREDQDSASLGEVSSLDDVSQVQAEAVETERKPFYFFPRVPRYEDENLAEEINRGEAQVEQRTQSRDAIRAEIQKIKVSCKGYDVNLWAAIAEEKSARKALHSNQQEMESLQPFISMADLSVLEKQRDVLSDELSKAEEATKAARKRYHEESGKQKRLQEPLRAADEVRQEAYVHLQSLRQQLREKNKYYSKYKDDSKVASELALKKDRETLQSFCLAQVETFMDLWNNDEGFRKYYIRCNTSSTLRRLGTLDGRSLGPDEEHTQFNHTSADKLITSNAEPEKHDECIRFEDEEMVDNAEAAPEPAEQKAKKPRRRSKSKKKKTKSTVPSSGVTTVLWREEREEQPKLMKEEEESLRKAEEKRKLEEAAELKEQKRLEEIAKAREGMERKKKKGEKAKARAALRAEKEAEEKDKKREKKLRKKVKKGILLHAASEDKTTQFREEEVPTSDTESKETESNKTTQLAKQSKSESVPRPLRKKGNERNVWKQCVWIVLAVLVVLALFLLHNSKLSFSPANLWFLV